MEKGYQQQDVSSAESLALVKVLPTNDRRNDERQAPGQFTTRSDSPDERCLTRSSPHHGPRLKIDYDAGRCDPSQERRRHRARLQAQGRGDSVINQSSLCEEGVKWSGALQPLLWRSSASHITCE